MEMAPDGVLITRPAPEAAATASRVAALGFRPVVAPVMTVQTLRAPLPPAPVQALVIASARAIAALPSGVDRRLRVLSVGDATARRATELGFEDVISAGGDATALAVLTARVCLPSGGPLLLAAGRGQGERLAADLRASGFIVHRRAVYLTHPVARLPAAAQTALAERSLRAALFMSAATASAAVELIERAELAGAVDVIDALAIGRPAAVALERLPWRCVRVAAHPDQDALLAMLR
jgi:uroporphyrinogen-III synthase